MCSSFFIIELVLLKMDNPNGHSKLRRTNSYNRQSKPSIFISADGAIQSAPQKHHSCGCSHNVTRSTQKASTLLNLPQPPTSPSYSSCSLTQSFSADKLSQNAPDINIPTIVLPGASSNTSLGGSMSSLAVPTWTPNRLHRSASARSSSSNRNKNDAPRSTGSRGLHRSASARASSSKTESPGSQRQQYLERLSAKKQSLRRKDKPDPKKASPQGSGFSMMSCQVIKRQKSCSDTDDKEDETNPTEVSRSSSIKSSQETKSISGSRHSSVKSAQCGVIVKGHDSMSRTASASSATDSLHPNVSSIPSLSSTTDQDVEDQYDKDQEDNTSTSSKTHLICRSSSAKEAQESREKMITGGVRGLSRSASARVPRSPKEKAGEDLWRQCVSRSSMKRTTNSATKDQTSPDDTNTKGNEVSRTDDPPKTHNAFRSSSVKTSADGKGSDDSLDIFGIHHLSRSASARVYREKKPIAGEGNSTYVFIFLMLLVLLLL